MSRQFRTTVAVRQNNAASDALNSQPSTLNFLNGKIYWTKNKSQPPLRRADFWTIEIARAKELSPGNARAKRLAPETIRIRDRARRKTKASLSIRTARASVPPNF